MKDRLGRELSGTLAERLKSESNHAQKYGKGEAVQVFHTAGQLPGWRFYRLVDYVVSGTASGPSLILVPRRVAAGVAP